MYPHIQPKHGGCGSARSSGVKIQGYNKVKEMMVANLFLVLNSWLFFRDVVGSEYDLLAFQQSLSPGLLKRYGKLPPGHGRRSSIAKTVTQDSARGDEISHWPVNPGNRFHRCRWGDKHIVYASEKCDAPLHIEHCEHFHGE